MEGRKGENVADPLGSYKGRDPSYSSGDAGKGAQLLCLSVCPAPSLLGYLYSPWDSPSPPYPDPSGSERSLGSWKARAEVQGSPGAGHGVGCDGRRCPVSVLVCVVAGTGYWGTEAAMGKWAPPSAGMLQGSRYCKSRGSIRSPPARWGSLWCLSWHPSAVAASLPPTPPESGGPRGGGRRL